MVNVEQQIQFWQPIKLADRLSVKTSIVFADAKFVQFQHLCFVRGQKCAAGADVTCALAANPLNKQAGLMAARFFLSS